MEKTFQRWQTWWNRRGKFSRSALIVVGSALLNFTWLLLGCLLVSEALPELQSDQPDTIYLNKILLAFLVYLIALCLLARQISRRLEEGLIKSLLNWFWGVNHEFTGAFILTALVLFLVTIPGERRAEYELKQQLIREMGSSDNGIAVRAVRELAVRGWLDDGSLKGKDLSGANLEGARLEHANLAGAHLWKAHLEGAHLEFANLVGAYLESANLAGARLNGNLEGAVLSFANLEGAHLEFANLEGAYLDSANLVGAWLGFANLEGADLRGANLEEAKKVETAHFDENTTLPDGTTWTPDTDMTRFTDPDHPDFWRSDDPYSLAYRGKPAEG